MWFAFYSLGYDFNIIRLLNLAMGVLFTILGNYLPRVKSNSVFGIRTFSSLIGIIGFIAVSAMTVLIIVMFSYVNYTIHGLCSEKQDIELII